VRVVEAEGQAGGVGQQVADQDGLFGRPCRRTGSRPADVHPRLGEGRQEVGHAVVELEAALFQEHQRGDGGDRFGHGVDAPQRVALHGESGREVASAVRGQVGDLPVPRDGDQVAGQPALVDQTGEMPVEPVQRLGVEADRPRLDLLSQMSHGSPPGCGS
jgi:hypothetical protein